MWYLAAGPWFAAWWFAVWVAVLDDSEDAWLDGTAGFAYDVTGVSSAHDVKLWQLARLDCQKTVLM